MLLQRHHRPQPHTSSAAASRVHNPSTSIRPRSTVTPASSSSPDAAAAVVGEAQPLHTTNGTAPPPQPQTQQQQLSPAAVSATKIELLEELAALDRGTLASTAQKQRVESLVSALETSGAGAADPFSGSPAPVEGRWQLIYNSKAVFTASPFFPAFQNGLVQDQGLAEAIFAFTDALPGATIGAAMQTVSLLSNSLISEVDMAVFPGFSGTVVTSARLQVLSPTRLGLDVQSTRVANSSFSPFLDGVSVPVEQLMEAVRGAGCTRVIYDTTYVDDSLRVTRCGDQLLLHRRV